METETLRDLLDKYAKGRCTPEEAARLETWYIYLNDSDQASLSEEELHAAELNLRSALRGKLPGKTRSLWPKIAAAAAVLLLILFGVQQLRQQQDHKDIVRIKATDIAPGSDQAVLTLANGSKVILKNAKKGTLIHQGPALISIGSGSRLVYDVQTTNQPVPNNTLSTPPGGQYPLVLADGTKVWLDASSAITYPVAFPGKRREVRVSGQAYFEVAHDPSKPFIVNTSTQSVEVLGTHFNINAYADEPAVKTTLMEGRVKIIANGKETLLEPGEQAKNANGAVTIGKEENPGEAVAWHNGMFEFHNAEVPTVMRQLSRWYNVEVSYEGEIPKTTFSGEIYRNSSALKVSDILSFEKIRFRIEGRKIIVMP